MSAVTWPGRMKTRVTKATKGAIPFTMSRTGELGKIIIYVLGGAGGGIWAQQEYPKSMPNLRSNWEHYKAPKTGAE